VFGRHVEEGDADVERLVHDGHRLRAILEDPEVIAAETDDRCSKL
jgi:hypothetical protein